MSFQKIEMNEYPRRQHYEHYAKSDHCTYSVTASIDVTTLVGNLKEQSLKFYPTFIYIVTTAVNAVKEFKMAVNANGELGVYDEVSASYIIFHEDDKTFSCAYTKYDADFSAFYKAVTADMEQYKDIKGFVAIESPSNSFPVSCTPWLNYTALNLNMPYVANFYAPIITWGKFQHEQERLLMPLTIQANHAVADGYHTAMLIQEVQRICNQDFLLYP